MQLRLDNAGSSAAPSTLKEARMSKKDKKKAKPADKVDVKSTGDELSEDQLERVAGGASDIFAKIGDIKGESLDDKHKDEIEVLSFSWGVTNHATMSSGAGGGAGKAT